MNKALLYIFILSSLLVPNIVYSETGVEQNITKTDTIQNAIPLTTKKLEVEIRNRLKKAKKLPAMDENAIRERYPMFATSIFNLLQNAETAIGARKK